MEDLTGRQFGPYQITAPLGEGGMAAVYQAYQPAVERYVAIKVLPRQLASEPDFVTRFRREARLLAQLQHPHILPVFDSGQADGYSYLVMPYIRGGTLAAAFTGQPAALSQIRHIISQIGGALQHAHAHGIIHRDVKPSNVMLDEDGHCLLSDFGLARMVAASENLTHSGAMMGTPAYMSPEQGSGKIVDARSDLYSLGVILYELATGRVPYKAETPIAVIFKHIQDPLPLARAANPDLPESLELVILKALSKGPEDRYQTADEFVQAVQAALPANATDLTAAGQPGATAVNISAAAPPVLNPGRPKAARSGLWWWVGAAGLVIAAVGLAASRGGNWLPGSAEPSPQPAQLAAAAPSATPSLPASATARPSATSVPSATAPANPPTQPPSPTRLTGPIAFPPAFGPPDFPLAGVFDEALASQITVAQVPALLGQTAAASRPAYVELTLAGYPVTLTVADRPAPQILIYSAPEYLATRPEHQSIVDALSQLRAGQTPNKMFMLVPTAWAARPQFLKFTGGVGFGCLIETTLAGQPPIANDSLLYFFQGLTADDRLILALLPVNAAGLPDSAAAGPLTSDQAADYDTYLDQVRQTLMALPASQFTPDLDVLIRFFEALDASPAPAGLDAGGLTTH